LKSAVVKVFGSQAREIRKGIEAGHHAQHATPLHDICYVF